MKYSLLSILLLLTTSLYATHYSYVDGVVENGDFDVKREIKQGTDYIDVTYLFEGFSVEKTTIDNQEFHLVRIGNVPVLGKKGDPELPTITDLLSVASSNLKVEIINQTFKEYKTFSIAPSRGPICQSEYIDADSLVFSDVYNKNVYFPKNNAELLSIQSYRSYPFASVRLCPIQYNPITKTIKCCSKITYRLSWSKKDFVSEAATAGDESLPLNYKKMPSLLKGIIADYVVPSENMKDDASSDSEEAFSKEFADYLIVTTTKFLPAVEKFKSWKSKLGYKCKVISKDDWTSSPDDVRQAIKAAYITNEKPEYLLIVGDFDDVPAYIESYADDLSSNVWGSSYGIYYQMVYGSWVSDLKYACMDGDSDYTADMARGRISVSSIEEANVVFDKIIKYEQNPVLDDDFYDSGLHCAYFQDENMDGVEDRRFVLTSEEIRNYMMGWGKTVNRVYTAIDWVSKGYSSDNEPHYYSKRYSNGAKLPSDLYGYGPIWQGTTEDVSKFINKGSSYVLHRDHGGVDGWGHPHFRTKDVKALANGDKQPVLFSLNCLTGSFHQNCFCEAFLRHSNGGAVGVIGATALSASGPNDGFAVGLFDAMYPTPGVLTIWPNGRTYQPSDLEPVFNMGHVMNKGLLMVPQIYGEDTDLLKYTSHIFHYFGDPSMELRTEIPACLDATVEENGSIVKVSTPIENCRISLCSVDDYGETYIQSFDGVSEAIFNGIDFNYAVTVYKHNYVPFVYEPNNSSLNSYVATTYIQDKTYTADDNVIANVIEAGNSVTSKKEKGDVLVRNVNVNYIAAKSVKLATGFSVSISNPEVKFVAKIDSLCPYSTNEPISSYNAIVTEAPEYKEPEGDFDVEFEEVVGQTTNCNSLAANNIKTYVENGEIVIDLGHLTANVIISDMSGKQIASKLGNGILHFAVDDGVYAITVQQSGILSSGKIVVE